VKAALPGVYNVADVLAKDQTLVGKLTPSGVVTIVDTLVKFVSQGYRRHAIAEAVTGSAPHVDALAAFIEAEVALHLEDVIQTRDALANQVSARPLTETTPVVAQMLPLVNAGLDARIAALKQLVATCQSFRSAHAKLARRIKDHRPWKHAEMLAEIKTDIATIVAALQGTASGDTTAGAATGASAAALDTRGR
jgi:hypothetical protein